MQEPKTLWNATEQEYVYNDTQIIQVTEDEIILEIYEPISLWDRIKLLFTGVYKNYYQLPTEIFNGKQDNKDF